jgi:chaperonin cofactor prefoldin
LDNTNATIIQTKEAVEQMKDSFTDISNLVKTMSDDYERIKTKLDTLETKIKKNWWMRIFGLGD